ncbi:MAG: DinB family protein [Gemmatimonadetes bacterium]|nr:DinB family protein [Gemmatimonadota bacterium]
MQTSTEELLRLLDSTRAELRRAVEAVPAARRRERPAEGRWSVAEVVEHVAGVERRIVEDVVAPRLEELRAAGTPAGPGSGPVVDPALLERLLDRSRRLTASASAQPTGAVDVEASLAALETVRAALRDAIVATDGLALAEVVLPHPVFGPLNLCGWITFLAGHEARHTAQIREVAAALA